MAPRAADAPVAQLHTQTQSLRPSHTGLVWFAFGLAPEGHHPFIH